MKVLIIPDIHNNVAAAEGIISNEKPDHTVFLGDYFDSYYDTPEMAIQTALWLKRSLNDETRTHIIGNHDMSYMTMNPNLKCPGYDRAKQAVISYSNIPWDKMHYYWWVDDWLCTHAGLSNSFFERFRYGSDIHAFLESVNIDDALMDNPLHDHRFFRRGEGRGGHGPGGILWCDYSEFNDIPEIKQIFGHTPSHDVRSNENHYCIDTSLNHYALVIDGNVVIQENF